jgi:anti-sigma regulatory factor (Ser/Thr protein kinase)
MASNQEVPLVPVGAATVACGPEAAYAARTVVSRWFGDPTHAEHLEDACLLVSELVTNSVLHADQPQGAPLRISAYAVDGVVRVEVEDGGHGGVPRRTADPRDGGYGLNLVELLAARWGVDREYGTCVWFELGGPAPGA